MIFFSKPPNIERLKSNRDVLKLLNIMSTSKDKQIQINAILALGEIGDQTAVMPLLSKLKEEESDTVSAVATALGNIGDLRAIPALIGILNRSIWGVDHFGRVRVSPIFNFSQVEDAASLALIKIGAVAVEPLLEELRTALDITRPVIIKTMGKLGKSVVVPVLPLLKHKDPSLRAAAIDILGMVGDATSIPALKTSLRDTETRVRIASAKALGQIGDSIVLRDLIDLLEDENSLVKNAAADALAHLGDPRAIEPLLGELKKVFEPNHPITLSIKKLHPSSNQLISALQHEFSGIRRGAAELLIQMNDPKTIDPLIHLLRDEASFVRATAAKALEKFSDDRVYEAFKFALRDTNGIVREVAVKSLINNSISLPKVDDAIYLCIARHEFEPLIGYGSCAVEPLLNALSYEEPDYQSSAAFYLGLLKDMRAVHPLMASLSSREPNVRRAAADALGEIGDATCISALMRLLSDPFQTPYTTVEKEYGLYDTMVEKTIESAHYPVRYAAVEAIKKLTQDQQILKIVNETFYG